MSDAAAAAPGAGARRRAGRLRGTRAGPITIASYAFIGLCLVLAVIGPLIAPQDPSQQTPETLLAPGSSPYWLGTDNLGRDQLSRVLAGAQSVVLTATVSVLLATVVGLAVGLLAGYYRGWVEQVLMRAMDALLSFPLFLLGIMIVAGLGTGIVNLIAAIAIAQVPIVARLVHGLALRESSREYVVAARAVGMRPRRIMLDELLPNLIGPVIVQATSMFAVAVGFATALSYLGLGVQPPNADWGLMVKEGQAFISQAPDLALVPGLLITLLLTAVTFAGDHLRDVLDPDRRLDEGFGK